MSGPRIDSAIVERLYERSASRASTTLNRHSLDLIDLFTEHVADATRDAYAAGLKEGWQQRDGEVAAIRALVRELIDKADVPALLVTDEWRELVARAKAATNG